VIFISQQLKGLIMWHVDTLPGSRLVNKFPWRQILGKQSVARLHNNSDNRRNCFLCGPRQTNWRNNRTSTARQRSCKHATLTTEDGVFHGIHEEESSWRQSALPVSQFSVGDSHEKFVVEEELEVDLWRLNMWFEDFMCAVVQWYLECDSYSSHVKICCQEKDRVNFAEV
jgi:hypothetical protein